MEAIDWADDQFEFDRNVKSMEQLVELGFETSKTFVVVTDGKVLARDYSRQKKSDLRNAIDELKTRKDAKIIAVSQSPECNGRQGPEFEKKVIF